MGSFSPPSATPARAAEAARAAILGCSAARERARRRAIGESWRRIDAPGWAQGALGVIGNLNWRLWGASGSVARFFAPPRHRARRQGSPRGHFGVFGGARTRAPSRDR